MKKVYVVTQGSYSDYHILRVFDNEELAKEYANKFEGQYDECMVEVYELNSTLSELYLIAYVEFDSLHEFKTLSMSEVSDWMNEDAKFPQVRKRLARRYITEAYEVCLKVPATYSKDRIKKIATDTLFQAITERTVEE